MTAEPLLYAPQAPLRILFVDDDPILREFAAANLSGAGAEVDTVADAAEALAILAARRPDVVVVSVEAPDYESLGVLEALRERPGGADIPVIVVTGREDVEAVDAAFAAGAASFVVKPLNWRMIAQHVRFTHRAAAVARMARDAPDPGGPGAAVGPDAATEQLIKLAREGVRFIAQAMAIDPALKAAALPFAAAADAALEARTGGR